MRDYTEDELNKMSPKMLVTIILKQQAQLDAISNQLTLLTEQLALMNQRAFGRKSEKNLPIPEQITLFDNIFNEAEFLKDDSKEPEITEVIVSSHTRKKKTKREDKLEGLPARIFEHKLSEEELAELFPNGYKELPPEIYKRLSIIPQILLVDEHHVHVYASKDNDGTMAKAKRPPDVFRNSIATPSLLATFTVGKYRNHLPIERQVQALKESGVTLESNTVANWMIALAERYFSILYDEFHKELYSSKVVHADETPFEVVKDGRKAGSKSQMWVYRNGVCDMEHPIVLYDYQPTRRTDHPDDFLKGYSGVVVTDGYQVYHSLENRRADLQTAGCWIHAKRKFAELVKATASANLTPENIVAAEATRRIAEISHLDNQLDDLSKEEREIRRQKEVKPKVDDFFTWAKEVMPKLPSGSATYAGLQYCLNQEKFLRVFLTNGDVPMDNNRAEQAIRPFTLGRKNWVNIFSKEGAAASSIHYSIIETIKANNLRVYDYMEYLISEMVAHQDNTNLDFLQNLLPWSKTIQEKFHTSTNP